MQLSGPRNPYPGKLGVVEEGALADLLLVDGDPLDDIGLLSNPEKSLLVIMKDGKLYKDSAADLDVLRDAVGWMGVVADTIGDRENYG